jgi:hypothetical protein
MTKNDYILILILILISCSLLIIKQFMLSPAVEMVEARMNGKIILQVPLDSKEHKYVLKLPGGRAGLEVKGRAARLFRIDKFCPNEICIKTGWIRNAGEKIICVPNKLVIELKTKNQKFDAMAR